MQKLFIALAFTILASSMAFAKTTHSSSSAPAADPYLVTSYGQMVGRDPDPNVRLMLMRDGGLLGD